MATLPPSVFPEEIQEVLRTVEPLRRPDPFGLEAALDTVLGSEEKAEGGSIALAISVAEELLQRCTSCDVMYTYNVLRLAARAMAGLGERIVDELSDAGLRIRMHCVAARAFTLHQGGDKASNLAQAGQHIAHADELDAANIEPERLAGALLDFALAVQLAPTEASRIKVPRLYRRILKLTAGDCAPDVRAVALANLGNEKNSTPAKSNRSAFEESDLDLLTVTLEAYGTAILPLEAAAAARRLGERLIERAEPGDGPRAIRWLRAAERSFYYHTQVDPEEHARNQLAIARYLSRVSVNEAEDQEYVRNKGLFSVQLAYAFAAGNPDLQAECFQTAAHLWAESDQERALSFLKQALTIDKVSPLIRGRLHLDKARSLAKEPKAALIDARHAIALFEAAIAGSQPEIMAELDAAYELKAVLLVNAEHIRTYRSRKPRIPLEAIALMSRGAAGAAERGDLVRSYLAYRRMAIWYFEKDDPEQALVHYRRCRDIAQSMLDSGGHERLEQELAASVTDLGSFDEARAAAIANPSAALRAAHKLDRVAIQMAAIDHQVAAFCAARLGRVEEALEWVLSGRLRRLRHHLQDTPLASAWSRDSLEAAASDVVIVFPLVQDSGTIVIVWHAGAADALFPIEGLTHAGLRRRVYDAEDPSNIGWLAAYQEFARDAPFIAPAPEPDSETPHELWWSLLEDAVASLAAEFAVPLHAALVDHGFPDAKLLVVPSALLSLVPLHATELPDGRPFFAAHPTELGFTPSLPGRVASGDVDENSGRNASGPPRSVLAAAGESELLYTSLELRTIARLFGERADVLDGAAATREQVLTSIEKVECVHLAGHGLFNTERWLDSRIQLGREESITLSEATARDLSRVRLVVLSACESGVSHVRGLHEEFFGFPAAFAAAGAQSVLSTLWRINDLSAALLLEHFYTNLLNGEHGAVALRDARAWLRALTAGELVARARDELAAPRERRAWRPVECSGIIGRFGRMDPNYAPFRSPYHWAAFTLWSTQ